MNKTLKLFSLLFMFVFSALSADPEMEKDKFRSAVFEKYQLTVTEVDPEFHCFALSNNMVFNIPKRNWEKETLPEVGTEIHFKPDFRLISHEKEDEIVIEYSQGPSKKMFSVWITPESKQNGLSCISSECILTAPAGWIFSEEYRDVLLLSDGSRWIKEKDGKTVFGPETRLIVSKQKDGGFSIIDLDASIYGCKCRTSGRSLTWHRFERVKPYVPEITKE